MMRKTTISSRFLFGTTLLTILLWSCGNRSNHQDNNENALTVTINDYEDHIIRHADFAANVDSIALRTGPTKILDTLKQFGLGHSTESGLVGEVNGTLNANRRFWSEIDKATIGFGYGIAVTPLQLSSAYATLANYGSRLPVSILRLHQKPTALQVADVSEVKRIHAALETVVSQGTGGKAAIDRYRIAGKTGTAKIAEAGGYGSRYFASFAGFAPISNPRFALVVVIRAPQKGSFYGGTVSGPVFRDVMTRALQLYNIAPDKPDK